jgi:hypothetical protein
MSSVNLRPRLLKVVFVILLIASLSVITATSSQAAPAASAHPMCGNCTYFDTWVPGSTSPIPYPCWPEDYNWDYPSVPIYYVTSHCGTRVWLHQYVNWQNHGWSWCVSPLAAKPVPSQYENPLNIYISANGSPC